MNENNNSASVTKKRTLKRGKFNFIDFLLVVVILILVAAIVYVFIPSSWVKNITAGKNTKIEYTVEIIGIDGDYINIISENDIVLDAVTKSNIGTVLATDAEPYREFVYDEVVGEGKLAIVPEKHNLVITIVATAQFKDGVGYSINGTRIAVGEKISLRFPEFSCEGYCISVPRES